MTARRTIVTGASSGIGAATAIQLASEGSHVWLAYASNEAPARDVAAQCLRAGAASVEVTRLDLRSPESISTFVELVASRWSHLEVLVNNGGVCPYVAFDDIDVEGWDAVLETNARGTFLLTRALLDLMRAAPPETDRSIVNISSIAGEIGGISTGVHYAASKAAILAITRSFARLLAPEGIRVNAVAPGPVTSVITDQLGDQRKEALAGVVPLGRFGTPDEVAWIIASLASPRSGFVTGATYDVNGGVHIA